MRPLVRLHTIESGETRHAASHTCEASSIMKLRLYAEETSETQAAQLHSDGILNVSGQIDPL